MLLAEKRILVTGVLNDASIAFSVAKRAQEEGAEVVLTSFGRAMSLTQRAARRLPTEPDVVELDVTDPSISTRSPSGSAAGSTACCTRSAFAPESCLGGGFLTAPWEDVARRAADLGVLAEGARGGVPAADGDAAARSSASTSTTAATRGPSTTGWASPRPRSSRPRATSRATSAPTASASTSSPRGRSARSRRKSIPGFEQFEDVWAERAPLGWDVKDAAPVAAACVALLSDLFPATTGEMRPRRRRLPRHRRVAIVFGHAVSHRETLRVVSPSRGARRADQISLRYGQTPNFSMPEASSGPNEAQSLPEPP